MTTIFSAISGQFSKSLLLGAYLPALVFLVLADLFLLPLFPADIPVAEPLKALDAQWQVLAIVGAAIVAAGLLYNLNIPIIRLFEGYSWEKTLLGQWLKGRYQARFRQLDSRVRGWRTLHESPLVPAEAKAAVERRVSELDLSLSAELPTSEDQVLPTRLGNVIRGFERYPDDRYSIESIVVWPRLLGKIDKDYAAAIDDAKSSFDFMLNGAVLSTLLAVSMLFAGLVYGTPMAAQQVAPWAVEVGVLLVLGWLLYTASLDAASGWGELVKSAFDLYRGDLLTQLGYMRLPATNTEERALWDDISQHMLYRTTPRVWPEVYGAATPYARSSRDGADGYVVELAVTRGVSTAGGATVVTLRVGNRDPRVPAPGLTVVDTVPDGFVYVWGSAAFGEPPAAQSRATPGAATRLRQWLAGAPAAPPPLAPPQSVPVIGTNPYHFIVGDVLPGTALAPGNECAFHYRIVAQGK